MIRLLIAASLSVISASGLSPRALTIAAQAPQAEDRMATGWWADRHRAILAAIARHPDPEVILLGDSITQNYEKSKLPDENFQPTWQRFYAPRNAPNLGFSGDATSHLLWRLQHGEVVGLHPKGAIVLIGTNDTGFYRRSADQTLAGIRAVITDLKQRLPRTRILLLAILPSAVSAEKTATDETINRVLATTFRHDPRVQFLDVGGIFRTPDNALNSALFYDPRLSPPRPPLHPDTHGQAKMAEAIEPVLAALLNDSRGDRRRRR